MTKIRLRYVKAFTDRHGVRRHYFRKKGSPGGPISGAPGSPEFMADYSRYMAQKPVPTERNAAGTFARLINDFYGSAEFSNLKPSSRQTYRYVLEPLAAQHGERLVSEAPADKIRQIVGRIGAKRPAMANLTRSVLRRLFDFAVQRGDITVNPASGIKRHRTGTHHTWTDAELAAYEARWPTGSRERLAYALCLYTGQRVGDVVKMNWRAVQGREIHVVQEKTGAELWIPLRDELWTELKAHTVRGLTLFGDRDGRPVGRAALSATIKRAAAAAGLPPRCVPHGLRKALMTRLANEGKSVKEIASISGHKSLREVERYTAAADQRRLARQALSNRDGESVKPAGKPLKIQPKKPR